MLGSFSSNEGFVQMKKKKNHKRINQRQWSNLEKNGSEIIQSPWGELEENLLIEIESRLSYSNQVRFHAVCKNWFAIKQYNTKPLPWVICITNPSASSFICQLYEPSCSSNLVHPTLVGQVYLDTEFPSALYCISNTIQKCGWIFFTAKDQWSGDINFLLFSPFTKKSIKLPPIFYWGTLFRITFSVDPNSRDCVFLLLYENFTDKKIAIKTFCHKYRYWRGRTCVSPENFEMCGGFPVYIKGKFYFVFPIGKLASYNVDRLEWKVECVTGYDIFPKKILDYRLYEAFELNGELMLICIDWEESGFVARFDWSKKSWVRVESLRNQSLFCTIDSITVSPIGKAEKNKGILPNKIYYGELGCSVYSLESGKLVKLMNRSGISSWDQTVTYYRGHWFEPPHLGKEKESSHLWRYNNPKKSVLPFVAEQCPNGLDIDITNKLDEAGEQYINEEDEELESLRILDRMRRLRIAARDNN